MAFYDCNDHVRFLSFSLRVERRVVLEGKERKGRVFGSTRFEFLFLCEPFSSLSSRLPILTISSSSPSSSSPAVGKSGARNAPSQGRGKGAAPTVSLLPFQLRPSLLATQTSIFHSQCRCNPLVPLLPQTKLLLLTSTTTTTTSLSNLFTVSTDQPKRLPPWNLDSLDLGGVDRGESLNLPCPYSDVH